MWLLETHWSFRVHSESVVDEGSFIDCFSVEVRWVPCGEVDLSIVVLLLGLALLVVGPDEFRRHLAV